MSKDDRYIAIARACLRAINDAAQPGADRKEQIKAVYDAIDEAFNQEFRETHESLAVMTTVLERIASGELDAKQSAKLAESTLRQHGQATHSTLQ